MLKVEITRDDGITQSFEADELIFLNGDSYGTSVRMGLGPNLTSVLWVNPTSLLAIKATKG